LDRLRLCSAACSNSWANWGDYMANADFETHAGRQQAIAELKELEQLMKRILALYDEMLKRIGEQYGEIAIN
jgi:hypothetical protein